jgi:two-component system nitrogen regulation response regulator NtrX
MKKKTIAILEDDNQALEVLISFFSSKGFDVYGAPSGFDIIKDIFARKPDLIIADLGLPGMPGDQVLKTFKTKGIADQAPIIIVSACPPAEVEAAAKGVKAAAFLAKPYDMDKLLELVNQHLAGTPTA